MNECIRRVGTPSVIETEEDNQEMRKTETSSLLSIKKKEIQNYDNIEYVKNYYKQEGSKKNTAT